MRASRSLVLSAVALLAACSDSSSDPAPVTEAQVDAFVANNGYALASGLAEVATTGAFASLVGIPAGLSDGDDVASFTPGAGLQLTGSTLGVAPEVVLRNGAGDVTVSGAYRYAAPRTRVLTVPPNAFQPRFQGWPREELIEIHPGYVQVVAATGVYPPPYWVELNAPLQLPHGATITAFACSAYDSHPTANLTNTDVYMVRTSTSTFERMAGSPVVITTADAPGLVSVDASSIDFTVVDNEAFGYGLSLNLRVDAISSFGEMLAFLGCRVTYQVDAVP